MPGAAKIPVVVTLEGEQREMVADADGVIDLDVPAGVRDASVVVPSRGERYRLELTALEPAGTPFGGVGATAGELDDRTAGALVSAHDR